MSIMSTAYDSEQQLDRLLPEDFPWQKQEPHPDDYSISSSPIEPQLVYHQYRGRHNRLWLRLSWRLAAEKFAAMSFILDTGAPRHLYLSNKALQVLEEAQLTCVSDDLDIAYVYVLGRKCLVEAAPQAQQPANIIGLEMLKRLGVQLHDAEPHVTFEKPLPYIGPDEL